MTRRFIQTPIGGSYCTTADENKWHASRFEGTDALYVVFNFKHYAVEDRTEIPVNKDLVTDQMLHFHRSLSQHLYQNAARRFGKRVTLTAAYHDEPQHHVHTLIACETDLERLKIKTFCETFALKNHFIAAQPHIDLTRNIEAAQKYNGRFGSDHLIIF